MALANRQYVKLLWIQNLNSLKTRGFIYHAKKALTRTENNFELVLIDVTESPVERPKKNKEITTVGKRKSIPSNLKSLQIKNQDKSFVQK